MTITTLRYGSYIHGEVYREGRSWFRYDSWLSNEGERGFDRLFAACSDDDSPLHDTYRKRDPRCSCCYLGFAHTKKYHIERTEQDA